MQLQAEDPSQYLDEDAIVNHSHPAVRALASELRAGHSEDVDFARAAFEHVRDRVTHSWDAEDPRVTVSASEALEQGTGLCYSKAHLLAAVLRAEGVPTGLCYQILVDEDTVMVHGLIAVYLQGGWHRQDPRGNKPGVDAQFSLAHERLAWPVDPELGEVDDPRIYRTASAAVVTALREATDLQHLYRHGLPTRV